MKRSDQLLENKSRGCCSAVVSIASLLVVLFAFGACSSSTETAVPGEECDEPNQQEGYYVCQNGEWVAAGDAGFDVDDGDDEECEPETHEEFCERHDVECGTFSDIDNCDQQRTVHCEDFEGYGCQDVGTCVDAADDDDLETNVCECPELEGDPADEICDYAGADCGTIDAQEVCSGWDSLGEIECGDCDDDDTECGTDIDNVCGCPCEIDDTCYADGDTAPDEECLICDSDESDEEFTEVEDGTECEEGGVCQEGECVCEDGTDCDDECVDTDVNRDHCAECGNECDDDEICDDGECIEGCSDDETLCDGECVDTDSDEDHCGGCDEDCSVDGGSAECDDGQCLLECDGDDELCDDECVDTETDEDHCGECNDECSTDIPGASAECDEGECQVECDDEDEEVCDGECVDTDFNEDHCGECDNACDTSQFCNDGECEGITGECDDNDDCGSGEHCCDDQCRPITVPC